MGAEANSRYYLIVSNGPQPDEEAADDDHTESAPFLTPRPATRQSQDETWRYMAPFLLVICVFLLGVWALLGGGIPGFSSKPSTPPDQNNGDGQEGRPPVGFECSEGLKGYEVVRGDTCWEIASRHSMSLERFLKGNEAVECDELAPGMWVCVEADAPAAV